VAAHCIGVVGVSPRTSFGRRRLVGGGGSRWSVTVQEGSCGTGEEGERERWPKLKRDGGAGEAHREGERRQWQWWAQVRFRLTPALGCGREARGGTEECHVCASEEQVAQLGKGGEGGSGGILVAGGRGKKRGRLGASHGGERGAWRHRARCGPHRLGAADPGGQR
jgi:hypothetical protein